MMTHKTLRCPGNLHGIVVDEGYLEVKCGRRVCGYKPGVVVLHKFDIKTGELTETRRFRDPKRRF